MRFYTRIRRSCMVLFVLVLVSFCLCLDCIFRLVVLLVLFALFVLFCCFLFTAIPGITLFEETGNFTYFQLSLRLTFQIQLFRRSIKSVMSKEQKNSRVFSFAWSAQVWFNIIWEVAKGKVGFQPFWTFGVVVGAVLFFLFVLVCENMFLQVQWRFSFRTMQTEGF